jgi:hypothetical protein
MKGCVVKGLCLWLTAFTMFLLAESGQAGIDPETVIAMWLFDGDAKDSSGNANDGETRGAVKFVDDAKFGDALYSPKQGGSFVLVPHNDAFHVTEMSIVVWAKQENQGDRQMIISNRKSGEVTRSFQIKIETGQVAPEFNFTSGSDWQGTDNIRGTTDMGDGEWHHIAATYDKEIMKLYVDGNLEQERPRNEDPDKPGAPLAIGGQFESGSYPFSGTLDEIALFKVALDQEDIESIMNLGLEEAIGVSAVSASGKVAVTWADAKTRGSS